MVYSKSNNVVKKIKSKRTKYNKKYKLKGSSSTKYKRRQMQKRKGTIIKLIKI